MGYTGDKKRQYQAEFVERRRSEWITKQGGKCAKCGNDKSLEVDHIDRTLKTMYPRDIWSRREEIREAELANCQVLCTKCHKEKTKAEKFVAYNHGTRQRYVNGCRCQPCKTANAVRSTNNRHKAKMHS